MTAYIVEHDVARGCEADKSLEHQAAVVLPLELVAVLGGDDAHVGLVVLGDDLVRVFVGDEGDLAVDLCGFFLIVAALRLLLDFGKDLGHL